MRIRHKKCYKQRGVPQKRGRIPHRVGIEERPTIVETNTQIGHWEGDTVIGADHDGVLLTLVERVTKYTVIVKLPSKQAIFLAAHPTLTLTDLYNVVEKLRQSDGSAGESLNPKEQTINQQGLASVVLSLHRQIDAAVSDAYGWPHNLPDSEILTRLVQLNHERATEEAAGQIRYLRPAYQAPGRNAGPQQQLGINLPTSAPSTTDAVVEVNQQEWPKELAQQMQAVRDAVQQAGVPISTKQVAANFQRTNTGKVQPLLDTLAALALVRQTPEGAYAM